MTSKPAPCPLCFSDDVWLGTYETLQPIVECQGCGLTLFGDSPEEVLTKWNKRPDLPFEILAAKRGTNEGHGHVYVRPDGVKMRCGGPRMCRVCAADKLELQMSVPAVINSLTKQLERYRREK